MIKVTLALAIVALVHNALISHTKLRKIEDKLNKPLLVVYIIACLGYVFFYSLLCY